MTDAYKLFLEKFPSFTEVQEKAFPVVESGANCIIVAPTGTGKTEAGLLPILNRIKQEGMSSISCIYVTPLRALNRDLLKRLSEMGKNLGITIEVRHGDTTRKERARQSVSPPQVMITTPESLQSILLSGRLRGALSNLKFVIVDEIHELYFNKRGAQLAVALERIAKISGEFQRVGISATIGNAKTVARFLCGDRKCEIVDANSAKQMQIEVEMPKTPANSVKGLKDLFKLDGAAIARLERIAQMIKDNKSTIFFANTRSVVESIGSKLVYIDKVTPFGGIGIHHGSLDREERIKIEDQFKEGKIKAIAATSSLELGIDVGNVDLVIQYASPRQVTRLVQRVGRSGHSIGKVSKGKIVVASSIDAIESAALCILASEKKLEERGIEELAADVLVNQLCGMALERKRISVEEAYGIFKGAAPYSRLRIEDFKGIVEFAAALRMIRIEKGYIGATGKTRNYFIENISVIPDSSRFFVKGAVGGRIISTLDERFVSSNIEEGGVFIIKGLPWKVVSIDKDSIYVEPSFDFEAAIPEWEGEDIPVSYTVANKVFELLDSKRIKTLESVMDKGAAEDVRALLYGQEKFFVPSNDSVCIEETDNYAVVYAALGKMANELLGRVLGGILASSASGINVKSTPYSVIIDYSQANRRPDIFRAFEAFKSIDLEGSMVSAFLSNSELFKYKFIHVLKLFGVASKKAMLKKSTVARLAAFYKGTPIEKETLRDLYKNYLDIGTVSAFQKMLREGSINIKIFRDAGSPLTEEILKSSYYYKELMLPLLPTDAEIKQFAEETENKNVEMLCTYCGFVFGKKIGEIGEHENITCPVCGSPMVTVYEEKYSDLMAKMKNHKTLGKEEQKMRGEMLMGADLVAAYGKRALFALSTYGIGLSTAARILKFVRKDYRLFLLDLINAQKSFIRTRKFWADAE
ncbi:MAG: DEAD/DEAH box helicase [Candidatus Micrarchaeia archaeon]